MSTRPPSVSNGMLATSGKHSMTQRRIAAELQSRTWHLHHQQSTYQLAERALQRRFQELLFERRARAQGCVVAIARPPTAVYPPRINNWSQEMTDHRYDDQVPTAKKGVSTPLESSVGLTPTCEEASTHAVARMLPERRIPLDGVSNNVKSENEVEDKGVQVAYDHTEASKHASLSQATFQEAPLQQQPPSSSSLPAAAPAPPFQSGQRRPQSGRQSNKPLSETQASRFASRATTSARGAPDGVNYGTRKVPREADLTERDGRPSSRGNADTVKRNGGFARTRHREATIGHATLSGRARSFRSTASTQPSLTVTPLSVSPRVRASLLRWGLRSEDPRSRPGLNPGYDGWGAT